MSSLKNIFLLAQKNNKTGNVTYKEFKKMMKGADEQTKRQYFYKNNTATNPRLIERQTSLNIPILTSLNNLNISMNPVLTLTEGRNFGGSFNEAFKLARLGGLKTFTWNGNLYGTLLASENPPIKKRQNTGLDTSDENTIKDSKKVLTLGKIKNVRTPSVQIGYMSATPDYYGKTTEVTPHVSTINGKNGKTSVSTPIVTETVLLSPDDYSMYPTYFTNKGYHQFGISYDSPAAANTSIEQEIGYPVYFEMKSPETLSDVYIRRPNIDMYGNIIPEDKFVTGYDRITPVVAYKKQKGGTMNLNKFQQGGKTSSQQDAVMLFVNALAQTLQADPQLIIQAALLNPEALKSAVQVYLETLGDIQKAAQAFSQALQSLAQVARHGAKLNYLKTLKNKCADDEELYYFKKGGSVGCGCKKKEQGGELKEKKESPIDKFKKMSTGGQTPKKKKLDQASKDSIAVNNYDDLEILANRPGYYKSNPNYKKNGDDRALIWVPDRTKEPYKKEEKVKKNCGGSKMKLQKGDKVKSAGTGCIAKFKMHKLGGSLNGVPFYQEGTNKGGVGTDSSKKYTIEDINNYLSWRANDRPLTKFERFLTFRLGLPEKLVTSKFPFPKLELASPYNIFYTAKLQHLQKELQKFIDPDDRIKVIGHKNVTKHQEGTTE